MNKYVGYALYMGAVLVFLGPIFITPFLGGPEPGIFSAFQSIYAPSCHQLAHRSVCLFTDGTIRDCDQPGTNVSGRQSIVDAGGIIGYKFPVCARDLAIYFAMIFGGLLFPFVRKIDERVAPPLIYFIIALIPIALDGGTQLIGLRESTNELRTITGFIAGIAVPFYLIPIINLFVLGRTPAKQEESKQGNMEEGKKAEKKGKKST